MRLQNTMPPDHMCTSCAVWDSQRRTALCIYSQEFGAPSQDKKIRTLAKGLGPVMWMWVDSLLGLRPCWYDFRMCICFVQYLLHRSVGHCTDVSVHWVKISDPSLEMTCKTEGSFVSKPCVHFLLLTVFTYWKWFDHSSPHHWSHNGWLPQFPDIICLLFGWFEWLWEILE